MFGRFGVWCVLGYVLLPEHIFGRELQEGIRGMMEATKQQVLMTGQPL